MKIETIKVGELETNCYLIVKNNKCLIIDPGAEADKIINKINNLKVSGIIITHSHFDHIGALGELSKYYKTKNYDINNLKEGFNNIDDFHFEVIYTKGHTSDSITIYFKNEKVMFVGDFIFKESIGRTDLPTGSDEEMLKSINKIKKYPNVTIYPGHSDITTLNYEKDNNYYFN